MKRYSHPAMRDVTLRDIMAALADPCRMRIVAELIEGERALACNEVPLEVSKATRSHHFEVLRDAGLIRTCVEGTKCMTSLRTEDLEKSFPGLIPLLRAESGVAKKLPPCAESAPKKRARTPKAKASV